MCFYYHCAVNDNTIFLTKSTVMGKGDKRTGKGKRRMGSYGNKRPKVKSKSKSAQAPTA